MSNFAELLHFLDPISAVLGTLTQIRASGWAWGTLWSPGAVFGVGSDAPVVPPGYGIEHAQCVPPSEFSEPSFITESYQTLHPISSEELLSLKYESDYSSVLLREPAQDSLQTDYFSIKQEVVTPDNMCMGRASRGKAGLKPGMGVDSCCSHLPSRGNVPPRPPGSCAVLTQPSPNTRLDSLVALSPPCLSLQGELEEGLSFLSSTACFTSAETQQFWCCALMPNLSEIEMSLHVIREDKLWVLVEIPLCRSPGKAPQTLCKFSSGIAMQEFCTL